MPAVLHYDSTESGPRLRKTLVDLHGVSPDLVRGDIGGVMISGVGTCPEIALWAFVRPSTGERRWFVEAQSYYPPDVILWESWLLDAEPTDAEIREIMAQRADGQP